MYENELDNIAGRRLTLESQVNAIESANMNKETLAAIKQGADVLKGIHGKLYVVESLFASRFGFSEHGARGFSLQADG